MNAFHIAHIPIDPPVALAPMEGVTDRAFRSLIRSFGGCGLTVTEFVSSEGLTRDVKAAWRMAELDAGERPVSIQIYGRDPERMAQAARHCEGLGADIVDINLGCPSKRVTSGCSGSALMKEPALAREIFDAVHSAIAVPMTVKMRLGWDDSSLNAPEIAASAEAAGAAMVAVHGRTRMQSYKGKSRWDEIRSVKEAVAIPLVVNGDIVDGASARAALAASGGDGVMVGRGVMADPWAIARIAAELRGTPFEEPGIDDRHAALHGYLDRYGAEDWENRRTTARVKAVCGYFSKGLHLASRLRASVQRARSEAEVREILDLYFAQVRERDASRPAVVPG